MEDLSGQVVGLDDELLLALEDGPADAYDPDEMTARLLELDSPTDYEADVDVEVPVIEIVDDRIVAVRGVCHTLTSPQVFVLNALRISQGRGLSAVEIESMGFRYGRSALTQATQALSDQLNNMAGMPLFHRQRDEHIVGRPAISSLLSEVRVIDRRSDNPGLSKELLKRDCVVRGKDGAPQLRENGSLTFVSVQKRGIVTALMVDEYRKSARLDTHFAHLFEGLMGDRGPQSQIKPLRYTPANPEEIGASLAKKEAALSLYLSGKEQLSEQEEQIIIGGVQAAFELFARNLDLAGALGRVYTRNSPHKTPTAYEDLYQEAAMQLWEGVLQEPFNIATAAKFRLNMANRIKDYNGRGILRFRQNQASPMSLSRDHWPNYRKIGDFREEYFKEHGRYPDVAALSLGTSLEPDKIIALINAARGGVPFVYTALDEGVFTPAWAKEEDFVDREFASMEREEAMDLLFSSDQLSLIEKVVLSLRYNVFHPSLCGAEIFQRSEAVFTYPYSEEAFRELTKPGLDFVKIGAMVGYTSSSAAYPIHDRALAKAKRLLRDNSNFSFDFDDSSLEEQLEEERQALIAIALEASPTERIGDERLRAFVREGVFPMFRGAH